VSGVALAASGAAFAELGQPAPWEYKLQEAATPVMENIIWFHNLLLWIITIITLFVLALLITVVVKFNARANPVPSRTTHNTLIEVAWTLIPVLILVSIAVPSFRLLFQELDIPKADVTIKATGNQWNWTYAYPDDKIEYTSISVLWVVLDGTGFDLALNLTTTMISSASTNSVMMVMIQSRKL
jgi:cytochrome c oxidase subunit 2